MQESKAKTSFSFNSFSAVSQDISPIPTFALFGVIVRSFRRSSASAHNSRVFFKVAALAMLCSARLMTWSLRWPVDWGLPLPAWKVPWATACLSCRCGKVQIQTIGVENSKTSPHSVCSDGIAVSIRPLFCSHICFRALPPRSRQPHYNICRRCFVTSYTLRRCHASKPPPTPPSLKSVRCAAGGWESKIR